MIPSYIKNEDIVTDCETLTQFVYKYRKPERFSGRGKEYEEIILKSHIDELDENGYTHITRHSSNTGKAVYFINHKQQP